MPTTIPPSHKPDERKFIELVLLIANRSAKDPWYGYTKLNKLLFFSDFTAYGKLGSAITWQRYQKLRWGPCARRMKPIEGIIQESGWGFIESRRIADYTQQRLVAMREYDKTLFSDQEIEVVESVLIDYRNQGAVSISDLSHRFIGWRAARLQEDIPYETALVSNRALTQAEKDYALRLTPRA